MSVKASQWAWDEGRKRSLGQGPLLTLLRVADHADHDGVCWPGEESVAEYTAQDSRTVRRHLKQHEESGLLHRERVQRESGRGRAYDRIFLHLDSPDDQPDNLSGKREHDQPDKNGRPTGQSEHDQPDNEGPPIDREPSVEPSGTVTTPCGPPEGDALVEAVYRFWVETMEKPSTTKLSVRRKRAIRARAKEKFSFDDLKQAILGCKASDFHMKRGRHSHRDGPIHNDLTLIFRSPEKLEEFAEQAPVAKREVNRGPITESTHAHNVWYACKRILADSISDSTFKLWISPVEAAGECDGKLVLTAPDGVRTWIERRYLPLFRQALAKVNSAKFTDLELR